MKNFKLVKTTAALALGASVVTAAVVPGATTASAASKYKVSNGQLVNAKTGKVVKGYVVFKSKLYYNGKLKKGYKTVGSGKTIKLYYNGKLKEGYKTARNNKLLFFNGSLKKGYKTAGNGERLYKDGHLDKGYEVYGDVDKDPSLYYNGYLKSGYKTANNATLLFYNGKLKSGYKTAKEGTVLYKEGRLNEGLALVGGKLFKDSSLNKGLVKYEDKFYFDADLANGTYEYEGKEIAVENGVEVSAKVNSVEAINGTQLKVTFNKSVDATTAEDEGNYSLDNTALNSSNAKAELQDDSKTVILTLNTAFDNKSEHSVAVTISGILEKDSTTSKLPKFSSVIKVLDTTPAQVASVKGLTNGSTVTEVTVDYSEPVQAGAVIKIDGTKVGLTTAGESQTISGLSLDSSKEHTVEVVNLTDAAGNITAVATSKFTATKDDVAPEIKSLTALNDKEFVVEFSEKIKASTLTAADFKLANSTTLATVTPTDVRALDGDTTGTKFVVTTNLTSASYETVTSIPLTVAVAEKSFTDVAGNENAATTKSVTLSKDTTAPVVQSVKFTKASSGDIEKVTFTFDENVAEVTGMNKDAVEVVSKTGLLQSGFVTGTSVSGKTLTLTLKAGVKDGTYSFTLPAGFVTDTSTSLNKSAKVEKVLDFGAAEEETQFAIVSAKNVVSENNTNVITVDFGKDVIGGAFDGSATNTDRYTLNGKAIPSDAKIVLISQQKAQITLPVGTVETSDDAAVLQVSGVKTTTGLTNKLYTVTLDNLTDNVAPKLQTAQLLPDGKTFVLTYNENVTGVVTNDDVKTAFKFTEAGKDVTLNTAKVVSVTGKTVVITADKAVTTSTPEVKAEAAGFYNGKTAYTPVANDTILKGGVTYTYYAKGDVIVPAADDQTPAVTAPEAGFYNGTTNAYTPVATDKIVKGDATYTYYAKGDVIVPSESSTSGAAFDTTKAVTVETLAALVKDKASNTQAKDIKVTTTR
ncbi:hypothetical protein [Rummeliibacillus sp. TYF-LIM-RU47]|uniref:hypothetical protein n=1 Tax=Rummeliibacillus sp. TYF-LIM-RU47 TaxID=2608406 RepID=UPI00123A6331|nr:hypothetical protein [Rummeliibacillus sp. TYF-LIM-RU47]